MTRSTSEAGESRPTLTPPFADFLPPWLARQRWYAGKGHTPALTRVGGLRWQDSQGEVGIETHLVLDSAGDEPVLYHVPLTFRSAPLPEHVAGRRALVATADHSELGKRWIYDACFDPVYVQVLLDALTGHGPVPELVRRDGDGQGRAQVRAEPAAGARPLRVHTSRVLRGEQSNTSIIVNAPSEDSADGPHGAEQVIIKVFRVLRPGANPDVQVQTALAGAGSTLIPQPVGALWASWLPGAGGHLAFANEFLAGAQDGWERALDSASRGADFADDARALGRTIAQLHRQLREALPLGDAGADENAPESVREHLVADVRARFATAAADVPELAGYRSGVEQAIAEALAVSPWPPVQRVHGDYHLGQLLHTSDRGWVVLDFEGEPLRPITERILPTFALRDVAGMLRSFDYAVGSLNPEPRSWGRRTRTAFLDGYAEASGTDASAHTALLRLLELDKAFYEASYEARNRPDWVHIPVSAIRSLIEEHTVTDPDPAMPDPRGQNPDRPPAVDPATAGPIPADPETLARVARGEHHSPHDVLGARVAAGMVTIRTLRRLAQRVQVGTAERTVEARHEQDGIWVATLPAAEVPDYRLEVTYDGATSVVDDPYRFWPGLGEMDLHLIGEGRHERLWEVLGAHVRSFPSELGEVRGTSFAVWAPNAQAVRVVGDFNSWDGVGHAMRVLGSTGVWELFVPGVGVNTTYKFEIRGPDGSWRTKADPMARATEHPPATASVVTDSQYTWQDAAWMDQRARRDPHTGPMSIYEVHLGSWRPGLGYRELAEQLVEYVTWMGFTHVELMPVAEHPFGGSWGYQVTSYYAPSSRFGSPDEFRHLVDALHQAGIGVLVDWVPAHFPKDDFALARFDGTPLYEDPDPLRGEQLDWGTYVFNFGRNEVRNFLVANALYWLQEFHIDGLRVDAVASMLYLDYSRKPGQWRPNVRGGRENLEAIQFLQEANATAYRTAPGIVMVAEESTAWPGVTSPTDAGGLGFGLKWNMGWMNDTLQYLSQEPINRRYHHGELTFSLVYAFSEKYVLPLSHDEVVHGKGSLLRKMPGDRWQQLAGVRALLAYQWSHPGKKLLFMGQEFAQESEWSEANGLDWAQGDSPEHTGVRLALRRLNEVYREHRALWAEDFSHAGFEWLEANDGDHNVIAYLRKAGNDSGSNGPADDEAPQPGQVTEAEPAGSSGGDAASGGAMR